jgi:hypothetical protein
VVEKNLRFSLCLCVLCASVFELNVGINSESQSSRKPQPNISHLALRLCRFPCGKPLAFREFSSNLRLRLGGRAANVVYLIGKAKPFRKDSGKAAPENLFKKQEGVLVLPREQQRHRGCLTLTASLIHSPQLTNR